MYQYFFPIYLLHVQIFTLFGYSEALLRNFYYYEESHGGTMGGKGWVASARGGLLICTGAG